MEEQKSSFWKPVEKQLMTKWVKDINPKTPLAEYPRPQMVRNEWRNLNGIWDYAILKKGENFVKTYHKKILVPFPIESALSGVCKKLTPQKKLFYRRFFEIPSDWEDKKVILHFGAVDWETEVRINGTTVGFHKGGYVPFSFDITKEVDFTSKNELEVLVWDPTDKGKQEKGKQSLRPFTAFYTAVSGIWQTVWIEPVPQSYFKGLRIISDIDHNIVTVDLDIENYQTSQKVIIKIKDGSSVISEVTGDSKFEISIENPRLWSPTNPHLYDLSIELVENGEVIDTISSYFGMRKIAVKTDQDGIPRIELNNEKIFQYGPLDQGYWPDGLYTSPTDEALRFDIDISKELGFNMIRKHVKVEPARWYRYCDEKGILVWQDMPNGGSFSLLTMKLMSRGRRKKEVREQFKQELREMIDYLFNFPCIVVWVPFNEGWGQFETEKVVNQIKNQDHTRLINAASGWFDKKVGDILDIHKYPGPAIKSDGVRAAVLGEFGGYGYKIEGKYWTGKKLYWSYEKSKTKEELESKYENLMEHLKPLIKAGLTAAVYTQTTDIEGEINGFLTYDREMLKMDKKLLIQLHNELLSKPF
jgi:beta-galactosidase/beta-glucuronidase